VRRREFITLLAGAAVASPLVARAQQTERIRRIGVLMGGSEADLEQRSRAEAFERVLQNAGWKNGGTARIDYRWGDVDSDRFRAAAAELAALKPDILLATNELALRALQEGTVLAPIVFVQISDPVRAGFVQGMARPGGNITGFTNVEYTIGQKWLEALKTIAPDVRRVSVLLHRGTIAHIELLHVIEGSAPSFGVSVSAADVRHQSDIERSVAMVGGGGGMIILPHPVTLTHRGSIIELAARHHLPAVYPYRYFPAAGGLMSYGVNQVLQWEGAASYVDRILRGEKPGDLPVQSPTRFELVINLKTAKALGLDVPATLIARADEVIE
jgi:putative ABC transport system substrate-binding protein